MRSRYTKASASLLLVLVLPLICADNLGPEVGISSSGNSGKGNEYRLIAGSSSRGPGRIFTWRNYFRSSPAIEQQSDAPLVIRNPRFYSHWSWGFSIGPTLDCDVVNVSKKPVHSFFESQDSGEPQGPGGTLSRPESALKPGDSMSHRTSVSGKSRVRLTFEFLQFADGTTWYSNTGQKFVHPDGVRAGARDAAEHLIKLLETSGPEAVLKSLPSIHADVRDRMSTFSAWGFGHYCGVTNAVVKVQHANQEGGLRAIEGALRRILDDPTESDR
jgi:hypothetical protein